MTGVLIGTFLTDFVGRRPLILVGGFIMFSSLLSVGIAGSVAASSTGNQVLIAFSIIWVIAYVSVYATLGFHDEMSGHVPLGCELNRRHHNQNHRDFQSVL